MPTSCGISNIQPKIGYKWSCLTGIVWFFEMVFDKSPDNLRAEIKS